MIYFQPTYEGLKLFFSYKRGRKFLKFSAYLWGIETLLGQVEIQSVLLIFSLPMRDWNRLAVSYAILSKSNFQPTYEGLKQFLYFFRINTSTDFQPTYEGLKLFKRIATNFSIPNFQPTYEGLKPKMYMRLVEVGNNFQPTYEGLKHITNFSLSLSHSPIFSLPMRDWN